MRLFNLALSIALDVLIFAVQKNCVGSLIAEIWHKDLSPIIHWMLPISDPNKILADCDEFPYSYIDTDLLTKDLLIIPVYGSIARCRRYSRSRRDSKICWDSKSPSFKARRINNLLQRKIIIKLYLIFKVTIVYILSKNPKSNCLDSITLLSW